MENIKGESDAARVCDCVHAHGPKFTLRLDIYFLLLVIVKRIFSLIQKGQRIHVGIPPKKIYKWPMST